MEVKMRVELLGDEIGMQERWEMWIRWRYANVMWSFQDKKVMVTEAVDVWRNHVLLGKNNIENIVSVRNCD